jgi:hypothetical protein
MLLEKAPKSVAARLPGCHADCMAGDVKDLNADLSGLMQHWYFDGLQNLEVRRKST